MSFTYGPVRSSRNKSGGEQYVTAEECSAAVWQDETSVGLIEWGQLMIYDIRFGRNIWPSVEVEGEFARETELIKVLGGRPSPNRDVELNEVPVTLVPEPDNRHDKNAITVQAEGHIVGYLSRADAVRYQQPICRITASGAAATTAARIWASTDDWGGQKKFRARVSVALPEPDMVLPLNDPPEGEYNLLPWGGGVQVTKEEDHLDVLFRHVPSNGEGLLYVSLHKCIRILRNGTEKPFVEVRVHGQRAGELTPVTSAHFLPTIEHLETSGETAIALAKITGSAVAVQLVLQAAKAPEIPNRWFANSPNQVPRLLPRAEKYALSTKPARQRGVATAERAAASSQQPNPAPPPEPKTPAPANLPARTVVDPPQPVVRGSRSTASTVRLGLSMLLAVIGSLFGLAFVGVGISMIGSNFAGAIVGLAFGGAISWVTWVIIRYGRTGSFRKKTADKRGRERGEEPQEQ